jgi:hypothetical protein
MCSPTRNRSDVRALASDVPRERVLVEVSFLDGDGHGV